LPGTTKAGKPAEDHGVSESAAVAGVEEFAGAELMLLSE
jgi:hypothetical protein